MIAPGLVDGKRVLAIPADDVIVLVEHIHRLP
jgi:hypothetical protein